MHFNIIALVVSFLDVPVEVLDLHMPLTVSRCITKDQQELITGILEILMARIRIWLYVFWQPSR